MHMKRERERERHTFITQTPADLHTGTVTHAYNDECIYIYIYICNITPSCGIRYLTDQLKHTQTHRQTYMYVYDYFLSTRIARRLPATASNRLYELNGLHVVLVCLYRYLVPSAIILSAERSATSIQV